MFDRFTDGARKVAARARRIAQKYMHEHIGTDHLLFGLLKDRNSLGCKIIIRSGKLSLDELEKNIESRFVKGPLVVIGSLPFTPRLKAVFQSALDVSLELGQEYIGTQHLLFGLVYVSDGTAGEVLRDSGIDCAGIKKLIINEQESVKSETVVTSPEPEVFHLRDFSDLRTGESFIIPDVMDEYDIHAVYVKCVPCPPANAIRMSKFQLVAIPHDKKVLRIQP